MKRVFRLTVDGEAHDVIFGHNGSIVCTRHGITEQRRIAILAEFGAKVCPCIEFASTLLHRITTSGKHAADLGNQLVRMESYAYNYGAKISVTHGKGPDDVVWECKDGRPGNPVFRATASATRVALPNAKHAADTGRAYRLAKAWREARKRRGVSYTSPPNSLRGLTFRAAVLARLRMNGLPLYPYRENGRYTDVNAAVFDMANRWGWQNIQEAPTHPSLVDLYLVVDPITDGVSVEAKDPWTEPAGNRGWPYARVNYTDGLWDMCVRDAAEAVETLIAIRVLEWLARRDEARRPRRERPKATIRRPVPGPVGGTETGTQSRGGSSPAGERSRSRPGQ